MPITAFIGVRISWLIVARNELLASLADSAAARARFVSLNSRTFWIAITAWSAKVCSSAAACPVNGQLLHAPQSDRTDRLTLAQQRHRERRAVADSPLHLEAGGEFGSS